MRNNLSIISIVILNYQGQNFIDKTIQNILKLNYPTDKLEIIIVDNNSIDNSRAIINKYTKIDKRIRTVFLEKNSGFAGGNNTGIGIARGDFIALLNNDCTVDVNWLYELVTAMNSDPLIFAVAPKIMLGKSGKIQNAGSMMFSDGYSRDIGATIQNHTQDYENDIGQYDIGREVYSGCGASILMRKNILDKIGLLDESFFMYYEDVEICERARLHGYKTLYCPKAVAYHQHATTSYEWSDFFIFHVEKGRLLHIFYNFPVSVFISQYLAFTFKSFTRLVKSILQRDKVKTSLIYTKVSVFFLFNLIKLLRIRMNKTKDITSSIVNEQYNELISGKWYFN